MHRKAHDLILVVCGALALGGAGVFATESLFEPIVALGLDDRELMAPGGTMLLDALRLQASALAAGAPLLPVRGVALGIGLTALRLLTAHAALGYPGAVRPRQVVQALGLGLFVRTWLVLLAGLGFDFGAPSFELWIESWPSSLAVLGFAVVSLSALRALDALVVLRALCPPKEAFRWLGPLRLALRDLQTRPKRLLSLTALFCSGGMGLALTAWAFGLSLMKDAPAVAPPVFFFALASKVACDLAYQRALTSAVSIVPRAVEEPRSS